MRLEFYDPAEYEPDEPVPPRPRFGSEYETDPSTGQIYTVPYQPPNPAMSHIWHNHFSSPIESFYSEVEKDSEYMGITSAMGAQSIEQFMGVISALGNQSPEEFLKGDIA
jgi:hypothetical protein